MNFTHRDTSRIPSNRLSAHLTLALLLPFGLLAAPSSQAQAPAPLIPPPPPTTYSAGAGLLLTGTTFSIKNMGVVSSMIAKGAVTSAKIAVPLVLSGATSSGDAVVTGNNTTNGIGVSGSSVGGYAIYGTSTVAGIVGNGDEYGVYCQSNSAGSSGIASYGIANGVYGVGENGYGGYFRGDGGDGAQGHTTVTGHSGLAGFNDSAGGGSGVSGTGYNGVVGVSTNNGGNGVVGEAEDNTGGTPYGVEGINSDGHGYAGYFVGNVLVTGSISAGVKDFKIDHPLDPQGKYLLHASVESDQMEDIYSGNVVTDGRGSATVKMPDWFEALNGDFRYQLTVIGQFAQAIVGTEITGGQFVIKTDKPNVRVSWQVTGVRHDAFARAHPLVVEQTKPQEAQGTYLAPEAFGQPHSKAEGYARLAKMSAQQHAASAQSVAPARLALP